MNGTAEPQARVAVELENGEIYSRHNAFETNLIQWWLVTVTGRYQDSVWFAPSAVPAFRTEAS